MRFIPVIFAVLGLTLAVPAHADAMRLLRPDGTTFPAGHRMSRIVRAMQVPRPFLDVTLRVERCPFFEEEVSCALAQEVWINPSDSVTGTVVHELGHVHDLTLDDATRWKLHVMFDRYRHAGSNLESEWYAELYSFCSSRTEMVGQGLIQVGQGYPDVKMRRSDVSRGCSLIRQSKVQNDPVPSWVRHQTWYGS